MLILLDTGLRISEVVSIKEQDIDWNRNSIRVMGKGSKERVVPFGRTVKRALLAYLKRRGHIVGNDHIFVSELGDPLWREPVRRNIRKYGARAGLTGVRCSPHTFRHTFACNWIRNGGDVFSLQRILGHSTMHTVRLYVNLADSDLEAAHLKWSPVDCKSQELGLSGRGDGRRRLR